VYLEDTGGSERLVLEDGANSNRITMDANGIKLEAGGCTIELTSGTLKLTNGAHTLELGSSSVTLDYAGNGAQALVLAPLLDWLQTHQHVGNMGAPTPMFPADLIKLLVPVPPKKSGP
jgi:hypothetical protein